MVYEKKFIEEPILKYRIMKFLEEYLKNSWIANIEVQRTPLSTRIYITSLSAGRIIGYRGKGIEKLTNEIRKRFGIENPQINVIEVENQYLEPRIVARRAAINIERGKRPRSILHMLLRRIMESGAVGAEIVAGGKLGAKGARARSFRVYAGHVPKAGDPVNLVRKAKYSAMTKSGVVGISVSIVPPGTKIEGFGGESQVEEVSKSEA